MSFLLNKTMELPPESPRALARLLAFVTIITILFAPGVAHPEERVITAEASYLMGDGETPSFAEAMVLQKAKQTALEEAGTYVQSYTKAMSFDITTEEVQTITGGLLKTEILKKTRTLVGDGVRFHITIKAIVTAEKMEELARRIKGKNVAEEYGKLQGEYARLSKELEVLKQALPKLSSGADRDTTLDQLREREKNFRSLQAREANFFERLTSGETLFSKAMAQISQKEIERSVVDALFARILVEGYTISLGEPQIQASIQTRNTVSISVPVTIKVNDAIRVAMEETARMLGGPVVKSVRLASLSERSPITGLTLRMGNDPETVKRFQHSVTKQKLLVQTRSQDIVSPACYLAPWKPIGGTSFVQRGRVDPFGINPVDRFNSKYGSGTLGPMLSYGSEVATLHETEGFVMIADSPGIGFTLGMTMPIEQAKQMTSVVAKIVDVLPQTNNYGGYVDIPECTVGERSF